MASSGTARPGEMVRKVLKACLLSDRSELKVVKDFKELRALKDQEVVAVAAERKVGLVPRVTLVASVRKESPGLKELLVSQFPQRS
jgi:hypothetical protein